MAFVKINRSIITNDIFSDNEVLAFYVKLIFFCKQAACVENGIELKRGQFATSIRKLSEKISYGFQHTRTIINKLQKAQLIDVESHPSYSIITVNNFDCEFENCGEATQSATQNLTQGSDSEQHENPTASLLYKRNKNFNKQEPRAGEKKSESDLDARKRLVERFGERNVAEYEQRFEIWKSRQDRPVKVPCYEIIERWMKTDGAVKPPEPSYDVNEIIRRTIAQYSK